MRAKFIHTRAVPGRFFRFSSGTRSFLVGTVGTKWKNACKSLSPLKNSVPTCTGDKLIFSGDSGDKVRSLAFVVFRLSFCRGFFVSKGVGLALVRAQRKGWPQGWGHMGKKWGHIFKGWPQAWGHMGHMGADLGAQLGGTCSPGGMWHQFKGFHAGPVDTPGTLSRGAGLLPVSIRHARSRAGQQLATWRRAGVKPWHPPTGWPQAWGHKGHRLGAPAHAGGAFAPMTGG